MTTPMIHPAAVGERAALVARSPRRASAGLANRADPDAPMAEDRARHGGLVHTVAVLANASESTNLGLHAALECICRELNWCAGHAYLQTRRDAARYLDSGVWWLRQPGRFAPLVRASQHESCAAGPGLIGQVIVTGAPQWTAAPLEPHLLSRAGPARSAGVRCGMAFPILVKDAVAGVVECFTQSDRACRPSLLELGGQLGIQLGRLVERRQLEREVAELTHRMRQRLGEELHDTFSQQLTGISMLARSLQRKLEDEQHPQGRRARAIVESVQEASEQVRKIARGLHPVEVAADGLTRALTEIATQTRTDFGMRCHLRVDAAVALDDDFTATELIHIAREAVHNAIKHSGATDIVLEATMEGGALQLRVRDNGRGFDVDAEAGRGLGLTTLRHRAELIDARLTITSARGRGTVVRCALEPGAMR